VSTEAEETHRGQESFNRSYQIWQAEIKEGDLVLQHNSIAEIDMSQARKLSYKWLSPYKVWKAIPDKGTYFLKEFDSTELAGSYSSNRLKKFVQRDKFYMPVATDANLDNSSSTDSSTDNRDPELTVLGNPTVRRSAQIQRNAPRPGQFEIVPLSLTDEQRREYVRYEEDNEGNLI
jgi:hypothetical protein